MTTKLGRTRGPIEVSTVASKSRVKVRPEMVNSTWEESSIQFRFGKAMNMVVMGFSRDTPASKAPTWMAIKITPKRSRNKDKNMVTSLAVICLKRRGWNRKNCWRKARSQISQKKVGRRKTRKRKKIRR